MCYRYRTHSMWMVSFSAGGWCGPCTQLRPVYADAAHQLHGIVKSAVVDCDAWGSLCHKSGITAYPLIRFYGPVKSKGASRGSSSGGGARVHPGAGGAGGAGGTGGGVVVLVVLVVVLVGRSWWSRLACVFVLKCAPIAMA
jgi:hypothetical protein